MEPRSPQSSRLLLPLRLLAALLAGGAFALFAPRAEFLPGAVGGAAGALAGLAPYLAMLHATPLALALTRARPLSGFLTAWAYGAAFHLAAFFWLVNGLSDWVAVPASQAVALTVAFALIHGLVPALAGLVLGFVRPPATVTGSLTSAALLAATMTSLPAVFPATPEAALAHATLAVQVLDLGGRPLLLFLVFFCSWLLAAFLVSLVRGRFKRAGGLLLCMALIALLHLGYGALRLTQVKRIMRAAGDEARIAVLAIQPNMPIRADFSASERDQLFLAAVDQTKSALAEHPDTALTLWPELPAAFLCEAVNQHVAVLASLSRESGSALLAQCGSRLPEGRYANRAILVRPNGTSSVVHTKSRLVPFGEYLPYRETLPGLARIFPGTRAYTPGAPLRAVQLERGGRTDAADDSVALLPSLCYEALFPADLRKALAAWRTAHPDGPALIANLTNDGWFGGPGSGARGAHAHLAAAMLRAVELRLPMARVANTGRTALVEPTGELASPPPPTHLRASTWARLYTGDEGLFSLYARYGEAVPYVLWGMALLGLLYLGTRRTL